MKNLSVAKKIFLGIGCIVLLLVITGSFGIFHINYIAGIGKNYANISIPGIYQLGIANKSIAETEREALLIIASENNSDLDAAEAELKASRANLDASLEAIVNISPNFGEIVADMEKDLEEVSTQRARIVSECKKFTPESKAAAMAIFHGPYTEAFDRVEDGLSKISDLAGAAIQDRYSASDTSQKIAVVLSITIVIVAVVITFIITRKLTRVIVTPLLEIERAMVALAEGDFKSTDIDYSSGDELGVLADKVQETVSRVKDIIVDIVTICNAFGGGDLTVKSQCKDKYIGDYKNIVQGLYYVKETLTKALVKIEESAEQVYSSSSEVSNAAQALSQGATEQASSIEELSATITQISDQINENARNAIKANEVSSNAGRELSNSNSKMSNMINAMGDISAKSDEISKIIKTIDDIAFQTNILALNAAVEAARAGSAGKGFAVVADEVRSLAGKSAEAAKSTAALIEETISAVQNGTTIVDETAQSLQSVMNEAQDSIELVSQIATASNEQADAVSQITMGIEQISIVVQTNSATAEESAASSEELAAQSNMLKNLIDKFQVDKTIYDGGKVEEV